MLYKYMKKRVEFKENAYSNLPIKSIEEIMCAIEVNIEDNYVFTKDTKIVVFDAVKKCCYNVEFGEEEYESLNECEKMDRGDKISEIIENISKK